MAESETRVYSLGNNSMEGKAIGAFDSVWHGTVEVSNREVGETGKGEGALLGMRGKTSYQGRRKREKTFNTQ